VGSKHAKKDVTFKIYVIIDYKTCVTRASLLVIHKDKIRIGISVLKSKQFM
jgi:hypothetical protein